VIDPAVDCESIVAEPIDHEATAPPVIANVAHLRAAPGLFLIVPEADLTSNGVVTIGEDIGCDQDLLTDHALGRVLTAVDLRHHGLDDHALTFIPLDTARQLGR